MRGRMRYMAGAHHHGPQRHRARRGAIKSSVLRMLAERPMHGYELISEFEERTGGRWRPSPGSVYPTLAQLEDEGLVRAIDDDGKKRYEITDAGRSWLDEHAGDDQAPPWSAPASAAAATCAGSPGRSPASCASSAGSARRPSSTRPRRSSGAPAPSCTPCWPSRRRRIPRRLRIAERSSASSERSVAGDAAGQEVDRAGDGGGDEAFQLRRCHEPGDGFQRAHRTGAGGLFGGRS